MIITKTPLRITLGGGGTDLPSYYNKRNGYVLSLAINKYIYIFLNKTFINHFQIKYSQYEKVRNLNEIKHNLIRESFKKFKIKDKLEISSIADVPSGTGLGSSGTFGVGLFKALYKYNNINVSKFDLALNSSKLEINKLKENVGHQDNFVASYGGLVEQKYYKKKIVINKLKISDSFENVIKENLIMFYTGSTRSASKVLKIQDKKTKEEDKKMLKNLDEVKSLGIETKKLIQNNNFEEYDLILKEHWKLKKSRDNNISNNKINDLFEHGIKNGATAGKLVGAGGGGFILFYTKNKKKLKKAFKKSMHFEFDYTDSGCELI